MFIVKKINLLLQQVTTVVLLTIVYLVGIGLTSIIGKLTEKKFFDDPQSDTNWQQHKKNSNLQEMY